MTFVFVTEEMEQTAQPMIAVQNILLNLSPKNVEKSAEDLSNLEMAQTDNGIVKIFKDLMHTITIHYNKVDVFIEFLIHIHEKLPGLFSLVMSALIQPSSDSHIKVTHMRILRGLHDRDQVSLDDVITALVNFPAKESNQYMLYFCFFGKEIERKDQKVFTALAGEAAKLQKLGPTYYEIQKQDLPNILNRPVESDFKWQKIEDYCKYGYPQGSAQYFVKLNVRRQIDCVSAGDLDKLHDPSPFDVQLFGSAKYTLIQLAAFNGLYESVRALMSKKAKYRLPDSLGNFVMPYAIAGGNLKVIKHIQERNLDFSGFLWLCCKYRANDCFDYLLELEKDENQRKEQLNRSLLACAETNNVILLLKCLRLGANPMTKSEDGKTPLHYACLSDCIFVAKILSMCQGIDINAQDETGSTPLHYAATSGNVEIVDFLLSLPRIDKTIKNNYGKTPLEVAQD